jgi:homoaconitase/3-isopropylmalate dehydratase large subunit
MSQTIAEKIISSHCGQAAYAGEAVVVSIDLAMATGNLWFKVPGSIKLELSGRLAEQVTAKDPASALWAGWVAAGPIKNHWNLAACRFFPLNYFLP